MGDPKLESLMMTGRGGKRFLASPNVPKRKTSCRASQENTNFILRPSRFIVKTVLLLARLGP